MAIFYKLGTIDTSITHIRPRFKFVVPFAKEEVLDRIGVLLDNSHKSITGQIVDNHVILDIVESEIHYWSPQLNFRVEENDNDSSQSIVQGLIGPRPAVWTMFMFIYFSIGILGFFIASFGLCRWMLGNFSPLVWALPIAVLFMLTAYKAGKYGEQLGADQIDLLKDFVRDALSSQQTKNSEST